MFGSGSFAVGAGSVWGLGSVLSITRGVRGSVAVPEVASRRAAATLGGRYGSVRVFEAIGSDMLFCLFFSLFLVSWDARVNDGYDLNSGVVSHTCVLVSRAHGLAPGSQRPDPLGGRQDRHKGFWGFLLAFILGFIWGFQSELLPRNHRQAVLWQVSGS